MKFINVRDKNDNSAYIRTGAVNAVFYDEKEQSTAINYGYNNTIYVKNSVVDIACKLMQN